jgi:ATP-dependent Lon protease
MKEEGLYQLFPEEISDHEFIPLITAEDEDAMDREETPEVLPILPLRNTVLFPGVVIPITEIRASS